MNYSKDMKHSQFENAVRDTIESGAQTSVTKRELVTLIEWQNEQIKADTRIMQYLMSICGLLIENAKPFASLERISKVFSEISELLGEG